MDEISENIFNEELNDAIHSEKFRSEKIIPDWVWDGDPEFEAKKFRRRIIRVTTRARISKSTIIGSQSEKAQRERIHLCGELVMKDHLHQEWYAKSCREIEELKKMLLSGRKSPHIATKIGRISCAAYDQESRTVSLFFYDPHLLSSYDSAHVRHQESRAVKLECREIHEIIWVFLNIFDRRHAERDLEKKKKHHYPRNLATPSGIADDVEDSEKRNWE